MFISLKIVDRAASTRDDCGPWSRFELIVGTRFARGRVNRV